MGENIFLCAKCLQCQQISMNIQEICRNVHKMSKNYEKFFAKTKQICSSFSINVFLIKNDNII